MSIVYRQELGRELTWSEADNNFAELKAGVDSKKSNFDVLPVTQGGTGQTTVDAVKVAFDIATKTELADSGGAALVGYGDQTVEAALNERLLTDDLASSAAGKGAEMVGYDGGTVQDVLDAAKTMQSYTALRNYTGRATGVLITTPGIAGYFQRLTIGDPEYSAADNGGVIIVDAAGRRWKRIFIGRVSVLWFMSTTQIADVKSGAGSIDVADAISAAIAYIKSTTNRGTLYFPSGVYGVTSVASTLETGVTSVTLNILGDGSKATIFKKLGSTTTPVFDFGVDAIGNGVYSTFEGFSVKGTAACTGMKLTKFARYQFRDIVVNDCLVGVDDYGSLIADYYNFIAERNSTGFRCATIDGVYPNLMSFYGGAFLRNTTAGADIGDAQNIFFNGVDIEFNGTAGNTATGGVIIRSTCGSSNQNSNIGFNGSWVESNYGSGVLVEDATYLALSLRDVSFHLNENYRSLACGAIRSLLIDNCHNNNFNQAYIIGATESVIIRGGSSWVINNSATHWIYEGVVIAGVRVNYRVGGNAAGLGTYNQTQGRHNSGTGNISSPTSGSPVTLFTASGSDPRMFNVFVCLGGAGASYHSNARILWDGANLSRMGGENGVNMTITVSGANVQATQSSGVAQTIFYAYDMIG